MAYACDAHDGQADGVTVFSSLAPGGYAAIPRPFPGGPYGWTSRGTPFTVTAGSVAGQVVTYQLQPARTATVTMINDAGAPVLAGCLQVQDGSDRVGDGVRCDGDDGATDGVVHFIHLPSPTFGHDLFPAFFSPPPPGHLAGASVRLTYDSTGHAMATYVWRIRPAIADFDHRGGITWSRAPWRAHLLHRRHHEPRARPRTRRDRRAPGDGQRDIGVGIARRRLQRASPWDWGHDYLRTRCVGRWRDRAVVNSDATA